MISPRVRDPRRTRAAHPTPMTGRKRAESYEPSCLISHRAAFLEPDRRHGMIAEAAYYHAEHRGFAPGCELDDWLAAENEIDETLAEKGAPSLCDT